jgi:hypothetical protein
MVDVAERVQPIRRAPTQVDSEEWLVQEGKQRGQHCRLLGAGLHREPVGKAEDAVHVWILNQRIRDADSRLDRGIVHRNIR